MANFTDTANVDHLIGLWDFKSGQEGADTGLADGIAQAGHFHDDASASGDRLHTDGKDDWFDVEGGQDAPFAALKEGTVEVQFTQEKHMGGSPDVIVNRGERDDADDDGHFEIRVTKQGSVQVEHQMPDGTKALLTTDDDFFGKGDLINVVYTFDEDDGATFTVQNLSKGTDSYQETDVKGLHFDITDDDDESFTFGARETDDGDYAQEFKGAIDYVAIYDKSDLSAPASDYIVEGTNGADLIDAAYTGDPEGDMIDAGDNLAGNDEDLVDAGAGDDTVEAGAEDDTVYAGSGDDSVDGNGGDDVIYGDSSLGEADGNVQSVRESFEWDKAPDPDGGGLEDGDEITGFVQDTGNVNVTFSIRSSDGDVEHEFEDTDQYVAGIDTGPETIDDESSFSTDIDDEGDSAAYQLEFDAPVENVSFRVNDIDGDGVVRVTAFDTDGNPVEVVLSGGADVILSDEDATPGNETASSDGGYAPDDSPDYSVLVSIPGPLSRIVIEHEQDGEDDTGINVTDVFFDAPLAVDPEGPGDDTLNGDGGADVIYGETGDDLIDGGAGDDTVLGGDGQDTLSGGSGDDLLDGGADDDTIDGMSGNDTITDPDGDNLVTSGGIGSPDRGFPFVGLPDADPNDDRDSITTGDGDDTINSGDDADTVDAGDGDNVIDTGFDDDEITTGDGDDSIITGEGADTVTSGGGDDTIYGGAGPAFDTTNLIDDNVDPANDDDITDNGRDSIEAGDGDDLVFGQDDDDTIDGGAGDDTLDGGVDDDSITGGDGDDEIVGGQGADTLEGGFGDDTFTIGDFTDPIFGDVYKEGVGDSITGGEDADDQDEDVLDLSAAGPLKVVFEDSVDPTGESGESGTVIFYEDAAQTIEKGRLTFKEIENVIPCFTPGALIATPKGEVPVESLREGDKVITRDNGIQEIRWVGSRTLNRRELAEAPNLKPILIKAGSLGHGLPERDMVVSPQHRVLVSGERTQLYFDESEVLVAAKHLVNTGSIQTMETLRTTYIHFMCDRHEVVLSDGAWTESFQPGDQSLGSMGEATRDEIFALFPELATEGGIRDYAAARRPLKAHEAKLLQL